MRRHATPRARTPFRPSTLQITLTFLVLGVILAAATLRAEDTSRFRADTGGEKTAQRGEADHQGFLPPGFSRAHVSGAVGANLVPDKVLPAAYDARSDGFVSPVKNQGACGACYAFGTAADMEARLLMDGQGTFDISENNIKECNYQDASCLGGNQYITISQLTRTGVVLEDCDPYQAANTSCNNSCTTRFTVMEWLEISGETMPATDVLKQYLLDHGPLQTTVFAGDGTEPVFLSQFNNYNGTGALYFTGTNTPNHSVFLVGWDDSIVHAGGSGAWIVKNSWGTSWGGTCGYGTERGYFYIAYGSASIGLYSSVIKEYMNALPEFSVLSNDEGGYNSSFGGVTPLVWGLSSLTATADTYLHRVEFWTTDVTSDVDVYVYGTFSGGATSNLLASSTDHSFAEPGYHYVQLAEPLALNAGQTVYVAVKFQNQSYIYPLAIDMDGPVDSGKSYISGTGSGWTSLAAYNCDTTIRARVSTDTALSIDDPGQAPPPSALPANLRLEAAYPNPFNPNTTVEYSLHQDGPVELKVYDLKGGVVRTLVDETQSAGIHQVIWDGRSDQGGRVPSGVYFCRAEAGSQVSALKLVLLK
jgi:C1A family cysteine protease